ELYIDNPISSQYNVMRPSVLPNLLHVVSNNQACGRDGVAVFELGDVYIALDRSDCVVCGVRSGNDLPRNPHSSIQKFDFFDVKGDVEQIFLQFGIDEADLEFRASTRDYLHPSRSADVYFQGRLCGYVGELHPSFVEFFELKDKVACFEVFLSGLSFGQEGKKSGGFFLNKYQVVKRDFAFVLDKEIKARDLVTVVKAVKYVEAVSVFDVYSGVNIPEGKVSIAVTVVITSGLGTMTEVEIKEVSDSIVESVKKELRGQLRLESV
ncbi:MAG: phenylalanine--tRNA ligase subunit beta, partial [Anaplasma sp.]|nr:phenylalanine--tRNA ligase subunit beta [Anaplasma sp.]